MTLMAKCGQTKSRDRKFFTSDSLKEHERMCDGCKRLNKRFARRADDDPREDTEVANEQSTIR